MNSEAPGCSNRITYQQRQNAYKILKRDAMESNGRETGPKRRIEGEWAKGIIPDFKRSKMEGNVDNTKKQGNVDNAK